MTDQTAQVQSTLRAAEHKAAKKLQRWLALIVGILAIMLPALLYFGPKALGGCERYSISHFYYSPFWGSFFIGTLAFIGTYLFVYSSDDWDEWLGARIAGVCAFGVAFLPTAGSGCLRSATDSDTFGTFRARAFGQFTVDPQGATTLTTQPMDETLFELLDTQILGFLNFSSLHYIFAGILFAVLWYFCWFVFTRRKAVHLRSDTLRKLKATRNTLYYISGALILLSMGMIGWHALQPDARIIASDWNEGRQTFLWEAVALTAFGISWLTKGKFLERLIERFTDKHVMPSEM